MSKLRFGIIGAGGITHGHAKRIQASREAEVVAIAEPSERAAARFKEVTGIAPRQYPDHRAMLADKALQLDCILIGSPHTVHFEQSVESLRAGLHVLCEKPMVTKAEHAQKLIDTVKQSGKIFMISYQRHLDPKFLWMKEYIDSGKLGELHFIQALTCQEWLQGTAGSWRQDPALSGGGQINDTGSHLVDMLTWLGGPVQTVSAFCENLTARVDINSSVSFRYQNGALGTLSVIGDASCWWEDWTISGSKATIFYRNGRLMVSAALHQAPQDVPAESLPKGSDPDTAFIAAVRGQAPVAVPPEIGLRVIQLTEAAWRSSAERRPLDVSELVKA